MLPIASPSYRSLFLEFYFGDQFLASGTGFVVNGGATAYLITNRHNVTGRDSAGALLSGTGAIPDRVGILQNVESHTPGRHEWRGYFESLYSDSVPLWHEHPRLGANADAVALPLTELQGVKLFPYDVVDTGPLVPYGPSDIVSVVGFPFGVKAGGAFAVWTTGFVASEPRVDYNDLPLFLIDCRSRPGQSGSAVIAHRNGPGVTLENVGMAYLPDGATRFLGIYSGRIHAQSDLGIVWKANVIRELVESIPDGGSAV